MFDKEQLEIIQDIAKRTKNQGEVAVYNKLLASPGAIEGSFSQDQLNIVNYCAEECKRQRSGELSVYWMINAWNWLSEIHDTPHTITVPQLTLNTIETLGTLVEPRKNAKGFRQIPIFVGNDTFGYVEKAPWESVPRLLTLLLESYYGGSLAAAHEKAETREDQFYFEYENIHPFADGNGRTGKCIFAYLTNSMDKPYLPPNFWDSVNL